MTESSTRKITIAYYNQTVDAHVAKGKLESEGIDVFLADENIVSVNPLYSTAVGDIKLLVFEEDAERASRILGQNVTLQSIDDGYAHDASVRKQSNENLKKTVLIAGSTVLVLALAWAIRAEGERMSQYEIAAIFMLTGLGFWLLRIVTRPKK